MSTLNVTQIKNPDAASPALTLNTDGSVDIAISALSGGPLAGFRNAIINGNFDTWQRGASNSTHQGYSADRWGNNFVGSSGTSAQQAFTLGQTDVPGEPTFFMRTTVSSVTGPDNRVNLFQRIESVRTFAGQEVTLSFWAKANAARNISVEFLQSFGANGTPSAAVRGIGVTKVAIGTSWQRVTVTTTIPPIAGKTTGTDDDGFLLLTIWFDAGTNYGAYTDSLGHQSGVFDISQVQLEPGPVATVFERRPLGVELALCQRYFIGYPTGTAAADLNELLGIGSSYPVQSGVSATRYKLGNVTWPTTMRATPVITWSSTEAYSNCTDFVVAASKFGCRSSALSVSTGPMYVNLSTGSVSIDAEL
jgi:hypothetical protein